MSAYFVTGTDTDAGKTLITAGLLAKARAQGLSTFGLKPVASGSHATPDGLRNADALALQAQTWPQVAYDCINPYAFAPPIAPHLAARQAGEDVRLEALLNVLAPALDESRDLTLIEGAGGWRVPLNEQEGLADLARHLELPVILVVGLQLGCLNHARLTCEAIIRDGLPLAGWVGNLLDPAFVEDGAVYQANLASLRRYLPGPCLGIVPRLSGSDPATLAQTAAEHLTLPRFEESP